MFTPGITAPFWSVTVPLNAPVDCAKSPGAAIKHKAVTNSFSDNFDIINAPHSYPIAKMAARKGPPKVLQNTRFQCCKEQIISRELTEREEQVK
jgi:hypothetical protein